MPSLYEISAATAAVLERSWHVDDETGEYLDTDDLDSLQMELEDKLDACACFVKNLEAEAAAIKAEEKALADRRRSKERHAERMRRYVADCMQRSATPRLETARNCLSFRRSTALDVVDESLVPDVYMVSTITTKPDKKSITAAIKGGEEVPGCVLVTRENLQIK